MPSFPLPRPSHVLVCVAPHALRRYKPHWIARCLSMRSAEGEANVQQWLRVVSERKREAQSEPHTDWASSTNLSHHVLAVLEGEASSEILL